MLFLPIVIFSYMFSSMLKFARSAPVLILTIILTTALSNILAFIIPYFESQFLMSFLDLSSGVQLSSQQEPIQGFINLPVPSFWSPKNGMITGLLAGIFFSFIKVSNVNQIALLLKNKATDALNKYFIPFIPLFIFGFFTKLQYEGALHALMTGYGKVLLVTLPIFVGYIGFLFLAVNHFNIKKTLVHIKDCFEAFITAFSTMSSIATMPLAFKAAQKHVNQKDYIDFIIPSVINIHMIGNGIICATTIVAIFYLFNTSFPPLSALAQFTLWYTVAHFSMAGVPGGAIMIIMPLTQTYLGFSNEMASIFVTVGILQDCFITTGNIAGNILYSKLSFDTFGKRILKLS